MSQEESKETVGLATLAPNAGSRKRRKRVGAGEGSGNGKTCGRGQKGQKSRSGGSVPRGFEGGQMPLQRRLPKIGFTSRKKVLGINVYRPISLEQLSNLEATDGVINLETFAANGYIRGRKGKVKVLGGGELKSKISVEAHAFSKSAREAIEKAGGEAKVVGSSN